MSTPRMTYQLVFEHFKNETFKFEGMQWNGIYLHLHKKKSKLGHAYKYHACKNGQMNVNKCFWYGMDY